ncbi:MAG: hypothetical protein WCO66_04945 [Candidatus Absconditabacteria bacterium]
MYKKQFLFLIVMSSVALAGCSIPPKNGRPFPDISESTGMPLPPPPPSGMLLPPGPMGDIFRKKMDDACLSGILQTGSDFFNDLNKNTTDKEQKLLFIKDKLISIEKDASSESKIKIQEQLNIIDDLIQEVKTREKEFKENPDKICAQRGEGLTTMNKKMREGILGLSGNMGAIREHEKKEGFLKNMIEKIFSKENSKEDKQSDTPKENSQNEKQD